MAPVRQLHLGVNGAETAAACDEAGKYAREPAELETCAIRDRVSDVPRARDTQAETLQYRAWIYAVRPSDVRLR